MRREDIYDAWAPAGSEWSQWVKPVLFAHLPLPGAASADISIDDRLADRLPPSDGATALVLDLPGALGAQMTGPLVERRYRPVPLYNSCPPPESWSAEGASFASLLSSQGAPPTRWPAVDVQPILEAIQTNASLLQRAHLPHDAPPAFLLDADRRTGRRPFVSEPGAFDNRSISLPTDFPSSNFLLSRGIRRVVLLQQNAMQPQADLSHTLLRWQRAGVFIMGITVAPDTDVRFPQPITVQRPPFFRNAWYGLMARLGLRPNLLGGFGGVLPNASGVG